jgi:hypothetical protein
LNAKPHKFFIGTHWYFQTLKEPLFTSSPRINRPSILRRYDGVARRLQPSAKRAFEAPETKKAGEAPALFAACGP